MTDTQNSQESANTRQSWVRPELVELSKTPDDISSSNGPFVDLTFTLTS
ncbi:MAG: hypothetical protein AAFX04_14280 [Pseudomonadota bacterium]